MPLNFRSSLLTCAVALATALPTFGVSDEASAKANELLNSCFVAANGQWFCGVQSGQRWTLFALRNASYGFAPITIDETDRLNGVSDRFRVYVVCDQHREWNNGWSEWQRDTPGAAQLIVGMAGGLLGFWNGQGEKKNGTWTVREGTTSHHLCQDRKTLIALIQNPGSSVASPSQSRGVPSLAETKAAAESGDAEAQYTYAKTFGTGTADWKRWMNAAAAQGYGAAEDEAAWSTNWVYFSNSDPKFVTIHLKTHGPEMRQALILASSAADKGFEHSRQLLAMAYVGGILLPRDPVESYKWYRLLKDAEKYPSNRSPNDDLIKTMSLEQVREGEARAANYRPGRTAIEVRNALLIPKLRLNGLASLGGNRVAIINGSKMSVGESRDLVIDGITVRVKCISIGETSAVLAIAPDNAAVTLRTGPINR